MVQFVCHPACIDCIQGSFILCKQRLSNEDRKLAAKAYGLKVIAGSDPPSPVRS